MLKYKMEVLIGAPPAGYFTASPAPRSLPHCRLFPPRYLWLSRDGVAGTWHFLHVDMLAVAELDRKKMEDKLERRQMTETKKPS